MPKLAFVNKSALPLCSTCGKIPFEELFQTTTSSPSLNRRQSIEYGPLIFGIGVEKILDQKGKCNFCRLLYECACQKETDLFRTEHIRDHLHDSEALKDLTSFKDWCDLSHSTWREMVEHSDVWPFGVAHDPKEGKAVREKAEEMFIAAEKSDIEKRASNESSDATSGTMLDATDAFQSFAAGLGVVDIRYPRSSRRTASCRWTPVVFTNGDCQRSTFEEIALLVHHTRLQDG
jgi:hypothetical protein